jgi:hypothetical protein
VRPFYSVEKGSKKCWLKALEWFGSIENKQSDLFRNKTNKSNSKENQSPFCNHHYE